MGDGEARPSLTFPPGTIFAGDYRIVGLLAEGGMGAVYVVDQLSTGKARALKVMRSEIAQHADFRRRFELEARVGGRIESDHLVEIQSAGIDGATPYLVMELLDGEDLGARIERSGALAGPEVRDVFEQLCHAVAAAHAAGIVHRDLKPANIFLAKTKRAGVDARTDVKVLDFGIAKLVAESATRGQTTGMIGTPTWMAPEQTEPGKTTPAADVWALGLILYYVLTGRCYWLSAADPYATFTQILKEVVMGPLPAASVRARAQRAGFPPELDAIVARCLVRDPARRYPDAGLFWNELRAALAPSSVRILAGGTAAGPIDATLAGNPGVHVALEPTAAAAPLPLAGVPRPPVIAIPPFHADGLGHGPAMASRNRNLLLWTIPFAAVAMFVVPMCFVSVAKSVSQRKSDPVSESRRPIILPTPTATPTSASTVLSLGAATPSPSRPPECRICTTTLTATGALKREAIAAVLDGARPMLDQQCLSARRKGRRAATTFAFVVRDGIASSREIVATSSTDGMDQCLLRGLADLRFPPDPDETSVNVTLAYDPNAR